jgi:hypothetical protein
MHKDEGDLIRDPRWQRLNAMPLTCGSCGATHMGLMDLASAKPDACPREAEYGPNSAVSTEGDFLSKDFCVLGGEDFFIRCVLQLPIRGAGGAMFSFGVWSSLSRANFMRYVETFDAGEQAGLGPWFGWFSNRLKGYPDTLNLKCHVHPRGGSLRPTLAPEPTDHPLAREQRDGITLDRLLDLYALNGHDLRPALGDI